MNKVNPDHINLGNPIEDKWVERQTSTVLSFRHLRPFRRPYSMCLGIHGVVEVVRPDQVHPSQPLRTDVRLAKLIHPLTRPSYEATWAYMLEDAEKFYGDGLLHSNEPLSIMVARMAVAQAISNYSEQEHGLIIALKDFRDPYRAA